MNVNTTDKFVGYSGTSTELDSLCYIEYLMELDIYNVSADINKRRKNAYLENYNLRVIIFYDRGRSPLPQSDQYFSVLRTDRQTDRQTHRHTDTRGQTPLRQYLLRAIMVGSQIIKCNDIYTVLYSSG